MLCLWSDQVEFMALLMGLILWSVLGFFCSCFSVNTRGLDQSSGAYLKLSISMVRD